MSKATATCHICGTVAPLTFEHIPPAAAFNGAKVTLADVEAVLRGQPDSTVRKRIQQRGMGKDVLCGRCNNNTGAWYADYYAVFAYQAARHLRTSASAMERVALPYHIYPLRVIKQVAAMMLAVNGPGFQKAQPDLVRFVLSKESRYWPTSAGQLYMAYLEGTTARQVGMAAMLSVEEGLDSVFFSEMSFRPFTFILSHHGPLRNRRLLNITPFAQRSFNEWTTLHFQAPVLTLPESPLPGMFLESGTARPFAL